MNTRDEEKTHQLNFVIPFIKHSAIFRLLRTKNKLPFVGVPPVRVYKAAETLLTRPDTLNGAKNVIFANHVVIAYDH